MGNAGTVSRLRLCTESSSAEVAAATDENAADTGAQVASGTSTLATYALDVHKRPVWGEGGK